MARTQLLEAAARLASQLPEGALALETDGRVVALLSALGQFRPTVDALGVELAAELDRRSAVADTSVARSLGERSPAVAIARLTGIDPSEAQDWIAAGAATTARLSLSGELLPPRYESLARTLDAAVVTPRAARTVADTLDVVAERCTQAELGDLEATLLDYAPQLTARELAKLCRQVVERYDPDGAEPREERLRAQAGVTVIQGRDGLVTWIVKMHPEAAGFVTAAVDARTAPRRQPNFADGEVESVDDRPLSQKRLDALVSIARDSLANDSGQVAGAAVTMVVTMSLDSLLSGLGTATIDGVDAPLSARTARRLAADALLIPVVLGGGSEPLDVGRACRLFTEPQRRALAVRDAGCIWPGCNAPPGWCEVAHLVPWSHGGPTDLANGALMCRFHHARFDNDGWQLTWRGTTRVLIPPPWVDAAQTPRRAGRLPQVA